MSQANNPIFAVDSEPPAVSGRSDRVSALTEAESVSKRPEAEVSQPPAASSSEEEASAGAAPEAVSKRPEAGTVSKRPEAEVSQPPAASSSKEEASAEAAVERHSRSQESRAPERGADSGRPPPAKPRAAFEARTPREEALFTERAVDSGRNHRVNPRAAVELDVSLGSDHNFYAGFVENLSAGGVFVATHLLRPVGEVIELSIHISDDDEVIQGTGEVRWIREYNEASDVPPGMGVKFLSLAEGAEKVIERFLAQRDPMFFDDED